ncbi:TonB-dependent receptor [Deminuibacter soli]|uniref:TonB-dependent receptor n=2 Tax=Deminuibacter soli TaxID=2291815 RepID=A0A3E1NPL9_9BACT|nr:TonB-dependent receptor [Deminuibacter soli]
MLLTLALLTGFCAGAQTISGSVKDAEGKTVTNATVSLLRAKDSVLVKLNVTDKDGAYKFSNAKPGNYLISVAYVGFDKGYSKTFELGTDAVTVPAIALAKPTAQLGGVTVVAKKPMVEVKADKTIVNVENSINAVGNDAMELLRKSPGVLVDKDDNLSLSGKNGVQIYIDGKPSPLTGKDLADYLRTIQSSQVESIELITNPSAKFEAAGNAGIINIKLKKNRSYGTNGSATAGYNIGTYAKYNAGLSLNNRGKKVNLFGNYNYNKNLNENFFHLNRSISDTSFDQHSTMTQRSNTHGFKAGADYYATARSTFGVMVNGTLSDNSSGTRSLTPIVYIPTGEVNRLLLARNIADGKRNNINGNVNYRFADTSGHELNVDGDYGWYQIRSNQLQPNYYYTPDNAHLINQIVYNMIAPTDINLYSLKSDYEQNFKKGRLGLGFKTSYVKTGNDFQRYNVYSSSKFLDTLRSNNFDYKENINAVYANYNRQLKGVMFQVGLRVENTNSKGESNGYKMLGNDYATYDSTFKRHYTDFFPSAALTFNKNPMNQLTFSYSRRIDRPAYQDLNPFEFKLDEYTYQKGNTQLTPQYTNSFSVTHMYKYFLNTTLSYSHVSDVFAQLVDTADKSKSFITKKNLATQNLVNLNISAPLTFKWYSAFINVNSSYSHYKSTDPSPDRNINLDVVNFNFYAQNTFKLTKTFSTEISGFYSSPSIWQGTFKSKQMWSVDAGVQQQVLKGKGTIKATVSDVFLTMRWAATSDYAGQHIRANGGWESRLLKLNFTYRFGSNQVKAARQRKTAADEESKRVNGGGGGIGNN